MLTLFAFVAVAMAEYVQIEYNKGSYELSEMEKCHCYADGLCYKYTKSQDETKIIEQIYNGQCTAGNELEDGRTEFVPGVADESGMKVSCVQSIPEHKMYYVEYVSNGCEGDVHEMPKVLIAEDNCELDYYTYMETGIKEYTEYVLSDDGDTVDMITFTDSDCLLQKIDVIIDTHETNECLNIDEVTFVKFFTEPFEPRRISIEYGTGLIEVYKLKQCYCFQNDACYQYIIDNNDFIIESMYSLTDITCSGETIDDDFVVPPLQQGVKDELNRETTYSVIESLPEHKFFYVESFTGDCTDNIYTRPITLLTENNCERDYYFDGEKYWKYVLSGNKKTLTVTVHGDNQCETTFGGATELETYTYDIEDCIAIGYLLGENEDGEQPNGIFYGETYPPKASLQPPSTPENDDGSVASFLLLAVAMIFFFF